MSYITFISNATLGNSYTIKGINFSLTSSSTNTYNYTANTVVTNIPAEMFYGNNYIISVFIPDGVTSIGYVAFYNCRSLISVYIPNSVVFMATSVFRYCTALLSISIPNNLNYIPSNTFRNCVSLTSIFIPNSVLSISDLAFYNCYSLQSISIPNSVININYGAFYNCVSLTSISIPNSVINIAMDAFYNCNNLNSITLSKNITFFGTGNINNILITSGIINLNIFNTTDYENTYIYQTLTTSPNNVPPVNINVSKALPSLSIFSIPLKTYGNIPFDLTAPTSNSTGAFTYIHSNTKVATISENTVTIVGAGNTTIRAIQDASGNYLSNYIESTLTVAKVDPSSSTASSTTKTFGDVSFQIIAPVTNSDGNITYESTNTAVATVDQNRMVTIVGAGSATIQAKQDASGNYLADTIPLISLTVNKADPSSSTASPTTKTFGDVSFQVSAPVTNSDGNITYESTNTAVATVDQNRMVIIVGAGSATIQANQDASGNYLEDTIPLISLTVNKVVPTLSGFSAITKTYGNTPFNLTAIASNSLGAFTYTSSNTSVATIVGNTVTIVSAGTTEITATQTETTNYLSGTTTISLTVAESTPLNPINITNGYELGYLLNTNAKYGNIQNDIESISKKINSNTTKKLATNTLPPKKITLKV